MNNNNEEKGKEDLGLEEDDGHVDKLHAMLMQGDDEPAFPFAGMASSDR
jgi:hypothetical protein